MSEWKTLKSQLVEMGGKNFIEVSLKQPPEGDKRYIALSKGWKTEEGEKRYKSNVLFDSEKAGEIIEAIGKIANGN